MGAIVRIIITLGPKIIQGISSVLSVLPALGTIKSFVGTSMGTSKLVQIAAVIGLVAAGFGYYMFETRVTAAEESLQKASEEATAALNALESTTTRLEEEEARNRILVDSMRYWEDTLKQKQVQEREIVQSRKKAVSSIRDSVDPASTGIDRLRQLRDQANRVITATDAATESPPRTPHSK